MRASDAQRQRELSVIRMKQQQLQDIRMMIARPIEAGAMAPELDVSAPLAPKGVEAPLGEEVPLDAAAE